MELNFCYLYPELLNLYGDWGNVLTIEKRCQWRGIKFNLETISLNQKLEIEKYDFFFIGGGQDIQQKVVAKDLIKKGPLLKEAAEKNKVFLAICGGYQLLGKYYQPFSGEKLEGVGIFDAWTESSHYRCIGNILIETEINNQKIKIIGFENHSGQTYLGGKCQPLGKVIKGFGNNVKEKSEGARYKNCFGTYLHGPLLPKNPQFADYLISLALNQKYKKNINLEKIDDTLEKLAFEEVLKLYFGG